MDLVEDRFPSRHAITRAEDYEEERRLLYVACTRAKDSLHLFVPQNILQRGQGFEERAVPSPFVKEIPPHLYEEVIEQYGGVLVKQGLSKSPLQSMAKSAPKPSVNIFDTFKAAMAQNEEKKAPLVFDKPEEQAKKTPVKLGYCRHKVFGRGKIIEEVDADKVRVNFTGMGLKVIMKAYLTFED